MRTLYVEGVATHDGPESCVDVRKGGGEALTGVRAGWAIEPRNQRVRGADVVDMNGRPHRWGRYREPSADPARSENLCMRAISPCSRTGRAHGHPWLIDDAPPFMDRGVACRWVAGRAGNTKVVIP